MGLHLLYVLFVIGCTTDVYVLCQVFEILAHPEDITVDEGHLVHMPCQSTEVNEVPWWTINGNSHSTTDLPFGFHATESGLVFPAYSNSTFQCYFTRYHPNSGKSFRHYSRIGTVNVRQITGNMQPTMTCKPMDLLVRLTVTGVDSEDVNLDFSWEAHGGAECSNVSYDVQLVAVNPCVYGSVADRDSDECNTTTDTIPSPYVCSMSTPTSSLHLDASNFCLSTLLDRDLQLILRVKSNLCLEDPSDRFPYCYSSAYLPSFKNTNDVTVHEGQTWTYNIASIYCTTPIVCISAPSQGLSICNSTSDDLSALPGNYTITRTSGSLELTINKVVDSLDGAVHTVICSSCVNCSCSLTRIVTRNFRLIVIQKEYHTPDLLPSYSPTPSSVAGCPNPSLVPFCPTPSPGFPVQSCSASLCQSTMSVTPNKDTGGSGIEVQTVIIVSAVPAAVTIIVVLLIIVVVWDLVRVRRHTGVCEITSQGTTGATNLPRTNGTATPQETAV